MRVRHVAVLVAGALGGSGCGASPPPVDPLEPLRVTIEEVGYGDSALAIVRESVAERVAERERARHDELPPAAVDGAPDPDAWPRVSVVNETGHAIVVWVSGPCARTLALPPHSQNSAEVCEGGYQLAGQVARGNFLPLVGSQENLENGYQYTFSFFVQSNPYERTRRRRRR